MLGVLEGFTIIGVVVAVGYVLARVEILPSNAGVVLNRFAFFVALPALMFGTLYRADLSIIFSSRLPVAAISFCIVALLYTVIFGVVLGRGIARTVLGATGSGMVNANNMGLPVATYIFGDPAQVAPILLFQLVFLTPVLLAVLDITSRGRFSLKDVATQPLRNPLVIGSLLGVVCNALNVPMPDIALEPLRLIGGAGIPLILIAFGMSLRGNKPLTVVDQRAETLTAVIFKVALMPLVAFLLGSLVFHLSREDLTAATVLAGLPTAQNLFNYASRYQISVVLTRDIVLLSTCAAVPAMLLTSFLMQ